MSVTGLRCEHLVDPVGIDVARPRLSWRLDADRSGARQVAYRVVVDGAWDSGRVEGGACHLVEYGGRPLGSRERITWRVHVWDETGAVSESPAASWEMGLLDASDWRASWIGRSADWTAGADAPVARLRRRFVLTEPPATARLYITALGLYEATLNGRRVGDQRLTPGWTDYRHRVQYQTYDVSGLLVLGQNVLEVEIADGWYAGWVGFTGLREIYGPQPQLLAQLELRDADGDTTIATDECWQVAEGPRRDADLLMGETVDARVAPSAWSPARRTDGTPAALVAPAAPPTRVVMEVAPVDVVRSGDAWVVDFGQNLVGWTRLRAAGPTGTTIVQRFGEVLDGAGRLYTENLRTARATDTWTLRGDAEEAFEPSFTFHGFRYAEVSGYPGELTPDAIVARVCSADLETTGEFECSDPLVNALQRNVVWGMRGNFLEVPTDCPQRDERLGWMGDAQVFAPTAAFNMDVAAFLGKWMTDVIDGQHDDGGFPNVAPRVVDPADGAPGWGDAGVIVPWVLYERYGDAGLLDRCFPPMAAWVDYVHKANPGLLWLERRNGDMGDWLSVEADSPKDVVATSYFARSADLVGRAAAVLGRDREAAHYAGLADAIRAAYADAYVGGDGTVSGGTQTVYALALRFGLLPEALTAAATDHLVADIERRGWHISTGFLGVAHLLPALSDHGRSDVAYRLLHQRTWPSWLYPVLNGATTIWERWDGWTEERGFQDPGMNSFNHYAFGAVGEWLYEYVAGIRPAAPGYERILIQPHVGGDLTWAAAWHRTPRGTVRVRWERSGSAVVVHATIPAGAEADIVVPGAPPLVAGPGVHAVTGQC